MLKTEIYLRGGSYNIESRTADEVLFAIMTAETIEEALDLKARIEDALAIGIESRI